VLQISIQLIIIISSSATLLARQTLICWITHSWPATPEYLTQQQTFGKLEVTHHVHPRAHDWSGRAFRVPESVTKCGGPVLGHSARGERRAAALRRARPGMGTRPPPVMN